MNTMSIVNEQMLKIEQFASTFFADVDPRHLTPMKIAFYSAMIKFVERTEAVDAQAQIKVLDRLYALRNNSLEVLTDNFMEQLKF